MLRRISLIKYPNLRFCCSMAVRYDVHSVHWGYQFPPPHPTPIQSANCLSPPSLFCTPPPPPFLFFGAPPPPPPFRKRLGQAPHPPPLKIWLEVQTPPPLPAERRGGAHNNVRFSRVFHANINKLFITGSALTVM